MTNETETCSECGREAAACLAARLPMPGFRHPTTTEAAQAAPRRESPTEASMRRWREGFRSLGDILDRKEED